MQPDRIRDSPLRTTKARKDRTRQAGAIRSELFMTSLLKGALETDTEISFYLPRSALPGLSSTRGVPYDPISLYLPSPARTAAQTALSCSASRFRAVFSGLVKNKEEYQYLDSL